MPIVGEPFRRQTQALASSLSAHRILLYTLVSISAVALAVLNALQNYSNFYSVAIYLSKSSRSILVFANFGVLLALLCGHVVQIIFFGSLRANEVERLYDRLWFFITESLLAFTIFRDEFDIPFLLMFGFLLFVKSFHWLAGDRIEWMDQRPYPGPSTLFHVRMGTLFIILWTTDLLMFLIAVENTLSHGVGGMVLFASEYGILMASIGNTIAKYLLSSYELRRASRRGGENAPPWENKSMWLFYIELTTDFVKLLTYLLFFSVIITYYGLPLNIVRDVYITARSLISRIGALRRYQSATRNMDQRYPNATEEEMGSMTDRTCIICREEMVALNATQPPGQGTPNDGPNTTPKKLPCGHIFHFHCLRSWLERQQSCPTCRRSVLENGPTQPAGTNGPNPGAQGPGPRQANAPGRVAPNIPPGINNPFGNPLGLVGRIFGPQGQQQQQQQQEQPPGQYIPPNAQAPGIVNPPANAGAGASQQQQNQQPIILQYCIHYQVPQHPGRTEGDALPPPPVFQGFIGPGGVWQPWNVPGEVQPPEVVPVGRGPTEQNEPTTGQPDSTPNAADQSAPDTDPVPVVSTSGSPEPTTPREAARLAALRRHDLGGRQNTATAEPSTQNETSSSSSTASQSMRSISSITTVQDHNEIRTSRRSFATGNEPVPQLIPLYDPSQTPSFSSVSSINPTALHSASILSSASARRPVPHTLPHFSSTTTHPSLSPLSHLPPTLTDEQLSIMDNLTREAIDERLRILDGVSTSVHRCVEDLMRMRSALPIAQAQTQPQTQPGARSQTGNMGGPGVGTSSRLNTTETGSSSRDGGVDRAEGSHVAATRSIEPSTSGTGVSSSIEGSPSSSWTSAGGSSLGASAITTNQKVDVDAEGSGSMQVKVQEASLSSSSHSSSESETSSSFDDLP